MDNKITRNELLIKCENLGLKKFKSKNKKKLIELINSHIETKVSETKVSETKVSETKVSETKVSETKVEETKVEETKVEKHLFQNIINGDSIKILPTLESNSAQIIIADPPYNIGKDFGNNSDKQPINEYLLWCDKWIEECLRILKTNGTMFIFGFSENLALILSRIPYNINRRWILWHYTNKNVPSLHFWQRSHESIIILWKNDKIFHRDEIRESYTDGFLNGAAGKERAATKGRFSKGIKKTTYTAHPNGALPRDVIKIPALAGGSGVNERVNHPTQKPILLCDKLIRSCRQPNTDGYVLIPFAGSGSECIASINNNLSFIAIEINNDYIDIINQRLNKI